MPLNIISSFDKNNACTLAQMCELVYSDEMVVIDALHRNGYTGFFIDVDDVQCFIAEHDNYSVIVFRGTDDVSDWVTNLTFRMAEHVYGFVHAGFSRAIDAVFADVKHNLNTRKPVFITGHSQGAALASLCAIKLRLSGWDVKAVYAYGQPRVGGHSYKTHYNKLLKNCTYRIVNNNDTVTRVPPRSFNYVHVGQFVYIDTAGLISFDPGNWGVFLDRVKGRIDDFGTWGADGVKDHNIQRYVAALHVVIL